MRIMDYSQSPLVMLLASGKFPGESGLPKRIETAISYVFIFESTVYKFYKNDSEFFNRDFRDLSQRNERISFTKDDFRWNRALNPAVYLETVGVRVDDGEIVVVRDADADELLIVMTRIESEDILFERLVKDEITEEDAFKIGETLARNLSHVRATGTPTGNYHELFGDRLADVRAWIASVEEYIGPEEAKIYAEALEELREKHREALTLVRGDEIAYGGDIHSHNAVLKDGEFFLVDTFSAKEEWLTEHHSMPAYRLGTDMWALTGRRELLDACLAGYEHGSGIPVDRTFERMFVFYSIAIAAPYHHMLGRNDPEKNVHAIRLRDFIRRHAGGERTDG